MRASIVEKQIKLKNIYYKWNKSFYASNHVGGIFMINPLTAKLFNWNFHPLEVVCRWRDPQLQVGGNLFRFDKMEVNKIQNLLTSVTFYL